MKSFEYWINDVYQTSISVAQTTNKLYYELSISGLYKYLVKINNQFYSINENDYDIDKKQFIPLGNKITEEIKENESFQDLELLTKKVEITGGGGGNNGEFYSY